MAESKYSGALSNAKQAPPPPPTTEELRESRGGRPRSKSSDPSYRPITVVLQRATIRHARRKLEDKDINQDLSELLQELLARWLQEG